MSHKQKIIFLSIATTVIVVAYLFWGYIQRFTGIDIYFPGIALFIVLMSLYVFINDRYTISFILFWLAFGNFIDELLMDNTSLKTTEIIYVLLILLFSYFYNRKRKKITAKP